MTTANVFPDTALLLDYQALETLDWEQLFGVDRVTIVVAPVVLRELSRLKNQAGRHPKAEHAAQHFTHLVRLLRETPRPTAPVAFRTVADPTIDYEAERLDPADPRDQLIATIVVFQQAHALEYVVLLSDDLETIQKAERAGIDVERLPPYTHLTALDPALPAAPGASTGGDGMAPRRHTDNVPESSRIVPLDGLVGQSPLYQKLPEPKLPTLPPIPVARRPERAVAETPYPTDTDTELLPEAIVHLPAMPQPPVQVESRPYAPAAPEFLPDTPSRPGYVEMYSSAPIEAAAGASESFAEAPPHGPALTRAVPELRLAYNDGTYRATALIRTPVFPSIDELTQELTRIRRDHPKLAYLKPSPAETTPDPRRLPIHERENQRIKRYNAALDAFYSTTEKYLNDAAEYANMSRRRTTLELSLINDSPVVLKSLYIRIRFGSNVRIFTEDHLPNHPARPDPPAIPNMHALFDAIRLPAVPVPSELLQPSKLQLRSRKLSPLEIRWNKGWDVIYSIREMERSHAVTFNPLYLVFNSFDDATSIRVPYRITVASSTQEERGQLELLVHKVIQ